MSTIRKEGFFALYKGALCIRDSRTRPLILRGVGMASPLVGMTGVNSLLFAAYGASKRLLSPFPDHSLGQIAAAGAMAGAANSVLASPGTPLPRKYDGVWLMACAGSRDVQDPDAGAVRRQGG